MTPFEFHAELFGFRATVAEALADAGFVWLSDYGAIDLRHDAYGVEVTASGRRPPPGRSSGCSAARPPGGGTGGRTTRIRTSASSAER
ncbi:hypothetical protein J0H58_30210 [bacterium]|nr:hypothetical protein [bacterium]